MVRESEPLVSHVDKDKFISASEKAFDCTFDGTSRFYPWKKPTNIPKEFKIGVIVGASGSGKSTILKNFGIEEEPLWNDSKAIVSHFSDPDDAVNRLGAVGLNTIPSWYKPYDVLSNGEKFRADLARKIRTGAVIDEFTSVVDRNVAKAASVALSRYINKNDIHNVVLSSCHHDIVEWLKPDWILNTDTGELMDGFFLSDPKLKLKYIEQTNLYGQCLKTIII